jgi:hypothetical protein
MDNYPFYIAAGTCCEEVSEVSAARGGADRSVCGSVRDVSVNRPDAAGGREALAVRWRGSRTKRDRVDLVREALADAPSGMVPAMGELHGLLWALLEAHPRAAEKMAPGVTGFRVRRWGKSSEVFLHYADGTAVGMSWLKCCGAISERTEIRGAYREAVDDQIAPLRRPGMHVDHVAPMTFAHIVDLFEAEHGAATAADLEECPAMPGNEWAQERNRLLEPRRSIFAEFHRSVAVLEVVTPHENLSTRRRKAHASQ